MDGGVGALRWADLHALLRDTATPAGSPSRPTPPPPAAPAPPHPPASSAPPQRRGAAPRETVCTRPLVLHVRSDAGPSGADIAAARETVAAAVEGHVRNPRGLSDAALFHAALPLLRDGSLPPADVEALRLGLDALRPAAFPRARLHRGHRADGGAAVETGEDALHELRASGLDFHVVFGRRVDTFKRVSDAAGGHGEAARRAAVAVRFVPQGGSIALPHEVVADYVYVPAAEWDRRKKAQQRRRVEARRRREQAECALDRASAAPAAHRTAAEDGSSEGERVAAGDEGCATPELPEGVGPRRAPPPAASASSVFDVQRGESPRTARAVHARTIVEPRAGCRATPRPPSAPSRAASSSGRRSAWPEFTAVPPPRARGVLDRWHQDAAAPAAGVSSSTSDTALGAVFPRIATPTTSSPSSEATATVDVPRGDLKGSRASCFVTEVPPESRACQADAAAGVRTPSPVNAGRSDGGIRNWREHLLATGWTEAAASRPLFSTAPLQLQLADGSTADVPFAPRVHDAVVARWCRRHYSARLKGRRALERELATREMHRALVAAEPQHLAAVARRAEAAGRLWSVAHGMRRPATRASVWTRQRNAVARRVAHNEERATLYGAFAAFASSIAAPRTFSGRVVADEFVAALNRSDGAPQAAVADDIAAEVAAACARTGAFPERVSVEAERLLAVIRFLLENELQAAPADSQNQKSKSDTTSK